MNPPTRLHPGFGRTRNRTKEPMLVMLSVVLTAATVFPNMSGETIVTILGGGTVLGAAGFGFVTLLRRSRREPAAASPTDPDHVRALRATWRMPALDLLPSPSLSLSKRIWMIVLRGYLVIAVGLVAVKVFQVAAGQ